MAVRTVQGNLPTYSTHVLAETSRGGILYVVGASGGAAFAGSFAVDTAQAQFLRDEQPGLYVADPGPVTIPFAPPEGSAAGYFQTSGRVVVQLPQFLDVYNKVTTALRKAESWGWSHVLAKTKAILPSVFLSLFPPYAIAFPWVPFRGVTLLAMDYVDKAKLEDLSWTLVHESLHHALYRPMPFPLLGWGDQERQHHLGIGMAFVVNAATLNALDLSDQAKWPSRTGGYPPGGYNLSPTKPPTDPLDLRSKSVVQPVPEDFGQRLDAMSTVISDWGTGGWVDQFGPLLNYVDSGVASSPDQLVLDLTMSNTTLAWLVAERTMQEAAGKWAEYRRIFTWEAASAADVGMLALMARLGLPL